MNEKERCPKFERCEAPLCPVDDCLDKIVWYPDEAICKLKEYQNLHWIKKQKKIVSSKPAQGLYFTVESLTTLGRIAKGVRGKNPDAGLRDIKPEKDSKKKVKTGKKRGRKPKK